jgi:hypothetical protein
MNMDDRIKAEAEVITPNVKLKAAPQEERPETVYLAIMGEGKDAYVSVVFYSRAKAQAWLAKERSPNICARLDAVSCADGFAEKVP